MTAILILVAKFAKFFYVIKRTFAYYTHLDYPIIYQRATTKDGMKNITCYQPQKHKLGRQKYKSMIMNSIINALQKSLKNAKRYKRGEMKPERPPKCPKNGQVCPKLQA